MVRLRRVCKSPHKRMLSSHQGEVRWVRDWAGLAWLRSIGLPRRYLGMSAIETQLSICYLHDLTIVRAHRMKAD